MWLTSFRPELKKFNKVPKLSGFSSRSLQTHIEIYEEAVKNARQAGETLEALMAEGPKSSELLSEMTWQYHHELDNIRLHELYFETLAHGSPISASPLFQEIVALNCQSVPAWKNDFIETALTREIGWVVTFYEPDTRRLFNRWLAEDKSISFLALAKYRPILALDMWEHAYILDYLPGERINYIGAFLQNIDWKVIENRLLEA